MWFIFYLAFIMCYIKRSHSNYNKQIEYKKDKHEWLRNTTFYKMKWCLKNRSKISYVPVCHHYVSFLQTFIIHIHLTIFNQRSIMEVFTPHLGFLSFWSNCDILSYSWKVFVIHELELFSRNKVDAVLKNGDYRW